MATDAAVVSDDWTKRIGARVEAQAERWREAVAGALTAAGVETVAVEGEEVRASGRGLIRRWMNDLAVREAGRGRP